LSKAVLKTVTFIAVFLVSIVIISTFMNMGNTDMTAEMSAASLPVISIVSQETELNLMHGYTVEMDEAQMRHSITPIGEDRLISARIETFGEKVQEAGYEIRSVDGNRLVEKTQLTGFAEESGMIDLQFKIKDLIDAGEEYCLIFLLSMEDGRQVRYYTRIVEADYHLGEKLQFIQEFHQATFSADTLKAYSKYLESNSEGDNSSLARVNIHSSLSQVAWGGLKVSKDSDVEYRICEIAPQTASVVLNYAVKYLANSKWETAVVEEYYRVRYTPDRMYLLDYERTMTQLFDEGEDKFANDKISLGIVDKNVEMAESDGGTVFAFENGGSLYSFNGADDKFACLFSFYDRQQLDVRTLFGDHGFKILQVDETGNVTFLVHGYMNRGRHEGECGIQVSYYSSTLNVVEEMAFIPYTGSAGALRANLENLAYVNGKNDLYLMLESSIYHVNLETKEWDVVEKRLLEGSYQVSGDQSMLAWQKDGSLYDSTALVFMNLNSGTRKDILAGDGRYIMPLGFMGTDLIYGIANAAEVKEDALGYQVFPMSSVVIQDADGRILKEYRQQGFYVTGCSIAENQITLTRVQKDGEGYQNALPDQIMYNEVIAAGKNNVETAVTQNLKTVVQIAARNAIDEKALKLLTPKEVLFEGSRNLDLETVPGRKYYVYGKYGVIDVMTSQAKAVQLAYENAGAVTAEDGSYIWKKDRIFTVNQIMAIEAEKIEDGETSLSVCLDSILQFNGKAQDTVELLESGQDALEILRDNLTEHLVLDLKGCSLDAVLYYPDRERPVLALMQNGSALLITGFNEHNVVLMDPVLEKVYKVGLNDAQKLFEENGNRFIAYW